ncbi:MAG: 16S rRNA (cytosine(967)-C(5))-methyltransferase RsmB [bacterium]
MDNPVPSVRKISVDIYRKAIENGVFADALLAEAFRKHRFTQRDKNLLIEIVNGALRWRGQLEWLLNQCFHGCFEDASSRLKSILAVSLYQLRFLDRVPNYAAINEGVEQAKQEGGKRWGNLVNAVLRNYLRKENSLKLPSFREAPIQGLAINFSPPEWMVRRWLERYGLQETKLLCEQNNRRPVTTLRVNTRRTSANRLIKDLNNAGFEAEKSHYFDDFIKVSSLQDLTTLSAFKDGHFAVQDESTAIAARLLAPRKGERVLDMCAAPGGKACYLTNMMQDTGCVIAVDRSHPRVHMLKQNIERLKLEKIQPIVADSTKLPVVKVDKILLDAPCSGLGVLSRRADLRWKRTLNDIHRIRKLQSSLLDSASRNLKKDGVLVYSTCTIEPEENEFIIDWFLKQHGDYRIDPFDIGVGSNLQPDENGFWQTLPHKHHIDGTFSVRLIKLK